MKKIIILNGAGKKNGATAGLINAFSDGAKSVGNEVKEFYLQTMNIHGCLDCQGCGRKEPGDIHPCVQQDDMNEVYESFIEADVVVFATPVYWFTITGTLKTCVDRLYAVQKNRGLEGTKKDMVLLMTSGAPAEMNKMPIEWYHMFEQIGWKDLGTVLDAEKAEEAKALGANI